MPTIQLRQAPGGESNTILILFYSVAGGWQVSGVSIQRYLTAGRTDGENHCSLNETTMLS